MIGTGAWWVLAAVLLCASAELVRVLPHGSLVPPPPTVRIAHPRDDGYVTVGSVVMLDIAHSGWSFDSDGEVCIDVGNGIAEVRHRSDRCEQDCAL